VRETLRFAETCQGPSPVTTRLVRQLAEWEAAHAVERSADDDKVDAFIAHLVVGHHLVMSDYEIEVFGLRGAADTLVGDAMLRGVRCAVVWRGLVGEVGGRSGVRGR